MWQLLLLLILSSRTTVFKIFRDGAAKDTRLNQLMMLGAHDAFVSNGSPKYRTQSQSIRCQAITSPTRIFDARFARFKQRRDQFWSLHPSRAGSHFAYPLGKHLKDAFKFLRDNPTEFLIWRVKCKGCFFAVLEQIVQYLEGTDTLDTRLFVYHPLPLDSSSSLPLDTWVHPNEFLWRTIREVKGKLVIVEHQKDEKVGWLPGTFRKQLTPPPKILTGYYSENMNLDGMLQGQIKRTNEFKKMMEKTVYRPLYGEKLIVCVFVW